MLMLMSIIKSISYRSLWHLNLETAYKQALSAFSMHCHCSSAQQRSTEYFAIFRASMGATFVENFAIWIFLQHFEDIVKEQSHEGPVSLEQQ